MTYLGLCPKCCRPSSKCNCNRCADNNPSAAISPLRSVTYNVQLCCPEGNNITCTDVGESSLDQVRFIAIVSHDEMCGCTNYEIVESRNLT